MSKQENRVDMFVDNALILFILYGSMRAISYFTGWDYDQWWVGVLFVIVWSFVWGYREQKKVNK